MLNMYRRVSVNIPAMIMHPVVVVCLVGSIFVFAMLDTMALERKGNALVSGL